MRLWCLSILFIFASACSSSKGIVEQPMELEPQAARAQLSTTDAVEFTKDGDPVQKRKQRDE